jgi:hypothetical protein
LHYLKGAMRLDHSKDMFVHVPTCTSSDFNPLTPVVMLIRCVFLHLVTKLSDGFLEQRINIKFCVKLRENASDMQLCLMFMGKKP